MNMEQSTDTFGKVNRIKIVIQFSHIYSSCMLMGHIENNKFNLTDLCLLILQGLSPCKNLTQAVLYVLPVVRSISSYFLLMLANCKVTQGRPLITSIDIAVWCENTHVHIFVWGFLPIFQMSASPGESVAVFCIVVRRTCLYLAPSNSSSLGH